MNSIGVGAPPSVHRECGKGCRCGVTVFFRLITTNFIALARLALTPQFRSPFSVRKVQAAPPTGGSLVLAVVLLFAPAIKRTKPSKRISTEVYCVRSCQAAYCLQS